MMIIVICSIVRQREQGGALQDDGGAVVVESHLITPLLRHKRHHAPALVAQRRVGVATHKLHTLPIVDAATRITTGASFADAVGTDARPLLASPIILGWTGAR